MIRINLIQKKQASYVSGGKTGLINTSGFGGGGGGGGNILKSLTSGGSEGIITLLKSVGIPLVLALGANFGYDYYIEARTAEMAQELDNLNQDKDKIQKELTKIKGFESVKQELERNELTLRSKIDTIEKLIQGRDFTVKSMITLAQAMPRDIWMVDFKATETAYEIKGGTTDLGVVSEFMTRLGQTIYFKDVTLKTSDTSGKQGTFELGARRE